MKAVCMVWILFCTVQTVSAQELQAKVTINQSWEVNYGKDGVPGGPNIEFTVPRAGAETTFSWDSVSHVLSISAADSCTSRL